MKNSAGVPKLYIWTNQLLFIGVSHIPYRGHMVVSDKLMVCIEGEFRIKLKNGNWVNSRTCLVRAGIMLDDASISVDNATVAIYYLAPITQDYPALENLMPVANDGVNYQHPQEAQLIEQLLRIRDASLPPEQAYTVLRDLIIQPQFKNIIYKVFDPRIIETIQRIRETVSQNYTVKEFAEKVFLSESRLEKLFKEQIGVPITKYRLRYRVFVSIIHMALGQSVTDAALAAGFASSAHFSKSFSAINGIPPSDTFLKPPFLEVLIADEVFEVLASKIDKRLKTVNSESDISETNSRTASEHSDVEK